MNIRNFWIALPCIFACVANTEAAGLDQPQVTFGGFGSLGVSHSTMTSGDYVVDGGIPKGPGLSNYLSTTNDTRIAGHMAAQMSPRVSVVMQVDAEYHTGNSYAPEVEFVNVKYALTPDSYVRAGRVALPTFLESENRDVGYTYAWIHPPVEVYRQEPVTHGDGLDFNYRLHDGDATHSIKTVFGRTTFESNDSQLSNAIASKNMWGIFDTTEYGSAIIHAGYLQRDTDSGSFLTSQGGTWVKDRDLSAGVQYDTGDWFVLSEWIQRRSTYETNARYASAGYRVQQLTPYLTYALSSQGSFLPGFAAPTPEAVRLATRAQRTVSLGVRWDFMKNTDFKFQLDQVKLSDNSNGFLANVPANVTLYGSKFYVMSAVVDFIF
ncbi:MAG TPA: hypothetical protein VMV70_10085 [Gallionella sp.]|nr:hypothetical protein [Gallionella sp.]